VHIKPFLTVTLLTQHGLACWEPTSEWLH